MAADLNLIDTSRLHNKDQVFTRIQISYCGILIFY